MSYKDVEVSVTENIAGHLLKRITAREARTGIIELGSMGFPLAVKFARAGFQVTGLDWDVERIVALSIGSRDIQSLMVADRFRVTTDPEVLKDLDIVVISAPLALQKTDDQKRSDLIEAVKWICHYTRPGQLIILEGTNHPRATEETVRPLLEASGLKAGRDFFLSFSPEKMSPPNPGEDIPQTPKVVSGVTRDCTHLALAFYKQVNEWVIPLSSTPA
jgi:UDP-N-acetyl-D-glucosamine dehydrogenase